MSALRITLLQTVLFWEDKAANLQMLEEKINGLRGRTEIVVLPEMFTTGFTMNPRPLAETMNGESLERVRRLARENRLIITGSLIIEDNGHYYNRLIWVLPNGQVGTYDKRHLFAFAGEDIVYTPGQKRLIASVKGWKINLQICYDLRFPVWARQQNREFANASGTEAGPEEAATPASGPEYDVLVYVANWPEQRILAWKTLLQARAIENQCYVIGVNRVGKDGNGQVYNGSSSVIGPLGDILYQRAGEEDIFTVTLEEKDLNIAREKFPFWKDGDSFLLTH
jgi:omega-amidase